MLSNLPKSPALIASGPCASAMSPSDSPSGGSPPSSLCPSCGFYFNSLLKRFEEPQSAPDSPASTVVPTAAGAAAMAVASQASGPSRSQQPHHHVSTSTPLAPSLSPGSVAMMKLNCGLLGGVTQAGLFNPWDRALYLSVKNERPFLAAENFNRPYQGFWQAIIQRTCSTGLYFPLEDLFMHLCVDVAGEGFLGAFLAGNLAGAINGIMLNPASAVKYQTWGNERSSFYETARLMWRDGGIRPFLKGTVPTILRDLTFGGIYSLLRNRLHLFFKEHHAPGTPRTRTEIFVVNFVAAGVATTVRDSTHSF